MKSIIVALLLAAWPDHCHAQATGKPPIVTITTKETIFISTQAQPTWMAEKGCGAYSDPFVYTAKARPCPTHSCGSTASSPRPRCTPAPSSVAFPPYLAGAVDCTIEEYTGPACSQCGDNYCTRALLPGETEVGHCPFGFQHATTSRECDEPRCGGPLTLPPCPTAKPPVVTDLTSVYTRTASCAVTTETGWPCSGCPSRCTVAGAVPSEDWLVCKRHMTTTTDRACPTLNCVLANSPTVCPRSTPVPTPWIQTVGCAVYVQTRPDIACPSCHEICYTPTPTA